VAPYAYVLGSRSHSDDNSKKYGSLILIVSRRGTKGYASFPTSFVSESWR
jgi:hypothetical protein